MSIIEVSWQGLYMVLSKCIWTLKVLYYICHIQSTIHEWKSELGHHSHTFRHCRYSIRSNLRFSVSSKDMWTHTDCRSWEPNGWSTHPLVIGVIYGIFWEKKSRLSLSHCRRLIIRVTDAIGNVFYLCSCTLRNSIELWTGILPCRDLSNDTKAHCQSQTGQGHNLHI